MTLRAAAPAPRDPARVAAEAAEVVRAQRHIDITVDTQGKGASLQPRPVASSDQQTAGQVRGN